MVNSNWSLVLFTLLAHSSAGTVMLGTVTRTFPGLGNKNGEKDRAIAVAALSLLAAGLAVSFFHLGYPANSFNAIRNTGSSWLSREIVSSILLAITLTMWITGTYLKRVKALKTVGNISSLFLSIALVYIMIRVYTIPAMDIPGRDVTGLAFISSSLFLGTAVVWGIDQVNTGRSSQGLLIMGSLFLLASLVNYLVSVFPIYESQILRTMVIILYLLALMPVFMLFFKKHKNKWAICGVIIMTLGIIAEILNRYMILNISTAGL